VDGEVTWSIDQLMKSRQDAAKSNAPVGNNASYPWMGRISAGRARPTGAIPAVQQCLRRTKTAYKVDKISESFAVIETHSTENMSCQSRQTLTGQLRVQLATPGECECECRRPRYHYFHALNFLQNFDISLKNIYYQCLHYSRRPMLHCCICIIIILMFLRCEENFLLKLYILSVIV